MKLNEALEYAVTTSNFGSFDFIDAQAIGLKDNPLYNINLDNGTSTLWILTGKPKDGSTETGRNVMIYKVSGQFVSFNEDVPGDYSGFPVINNDFANSDALAAQLKNSQEFQSFYNANKDSLGYTEISLGFGFGDINQMVWTSSLILLNGTDMLSCFWNYKTLEKILCTSVTGIEDNKSDYFDVFPNPSSEKFRFETSYSGNINIFIYNSIGKIIQYSSINIDNYANINISALDNGVYNLVVIAGKNVYSKQIIVLK